MSHRPVHGVIDIEPADVTVARPAKVKNVQCVRREGADGIGSDEEMVFVEMKAGIVVVV